MKLFFQGNTAINRQDLRVCLEIAYCQMSKEDPDLLIYVTGEKVFAIASLCETQRVLGALGGELLILTSSENFLRALRGKHFSGL